MMPAEDRSGTRLRLSGAQSEVWYAQLLDPVNSACNMADYLDVVGPLDIAVLEASLRQMITEAECLRSRFSWDSDGPLQVIEPLPDELLPVYDMSAYAEPAKMAEEWMQTDLAMPFDLTGYPLLRCALLKVSADRFFLYLCVHHILCDGFSRVILYRRLADIYTARHAGRPCDRGVLAPYRLLLEAEEAYLNSGGFGHDRAYWQRRLDRTPELLSLSNREPASAGGFMRRTGTLPGPAAVRCRAAALAARVSPATFMIAATAAYTARMTGVSEVLLTLPVTARVGTVSRSIPGMVANYPPLPLRVGPEMTRANLLRQTSHELAQTLKHQRYRGDRIRRDLGLRSDDRRPFGPFINVLPQDATLNFGPCSVTLRNLSTGIVDDFIITMLDVADNAVDVHLNANPELYGPDDLRAHCDRFTSFVDRFSLIDADLPVGRVDVLDPVERRRLVVEWNDTGRAVPPVVVPELFERQVVRAPDAVAVAWDGGRLSYAELNRRANALARELIARGAGPERVVALALPRSAEMVLAVLAVLKAGAAYLPVDPDYPAGRIAFMLADARPVLVVAAAATAGRLPGGAGLPVLVVDDPATARVLAAHPGTDPGDGDRACPLAPDHPAYVIYTSGSTGQPKGAIVHGRGMLNHLLAKVADLGITAADCVAHNAPVTFDVSVWQMLAALIAGGRVQIVDNSVAADPVSLLRVVADERVSVLEVVPALLRAALDSWDMSGPAPALTALRWLVVTGETLQPDLCRRWLARFPLVPLVNAYGPTECSDDVAHTFIDSDDAVGPVRAPIGRPLRNTRLYVLDDGLIPVPAGTTGELYVGGVGVGRGYLADPARSAAAFVADPFSDVPGARMYRTGDRARHRPDGQLEFIERRDHQVKIRGRRVELGEIEAALLAVPGVTDCAAVLSAGPADVPSRLVGYIVGTDDTETVRAALADNLPGHMVPSALVVLEALPLTANKKLDRKALPSPPDGSTSSSRRGPRNSVEESLCTAFAKVLGVPRVCIDDDFFAFGGDSIGSIQVVAAARRAGLLISPRDVFAAKTVEALAAVAGRASGRPLGVRDDGVGPLELTPIMRQLHGEGGPVGRFSQSVVVALPPGVDAGRLALALQAVIDHHDVLRMRLAVSPGGDWVIETRPPGSVQAADLIRRVEVTTAADMGGTAAEQAADVNSAVAEQATSAEARLDPWSGVMIQAVVIDAAASATMTDAPADVPGRLLLVVHHLAIDGVSWRILIPDLAAAWRAVVAGSEVALDPVATSFRRWARTLAEQARTADRAAELPLWTAMLGGQPPALGDRALDPAMDDHSTARRLRLVLPKEQAAALLTQVPARFHAEINDVLLTGLALAVADWRLRHGMHGGGTVIELEGHGREQITPDLELSRTVGWFTSAFPVCLDPGELDWDEVWAGGPAVGKALKRVKEQLRALPDHGLGYGLLRYINPQTGPELARLARPQIGFNYMGRFATTDAAGDWSLTGDDALVRTGADPRMPLPHALEVMPFTEDGPGGPRLIANWTWAGRLLADHDAHDIARTWFRALSALIAHAEGPGTGGKTASDLTLSTLTQEEIDDLEGELRRWGTSLADIAPLAPLQEGLLFLAEHNRRGPDVYSVQLVADVEGSVDPARLRRAVAGLLGRHANLRACFRFRGSGEPVQVIPAGAVLPVREADLCGVAGAEREAVFWRLADAERVRRFDLARPPLLRLMLVRLGERRFRLVWTCHHIVVDGWSMPVLMTELFTLYERGGDGGALPRVRPYRDYLGWLAGQDRQAARQAWRRALAGLGEPTRVGPAGGAGVAVLPESVVVELPQRLTEMVTAWARGRGLTVNTVLQGCWAVLVGALTGRQDVVFGATSSGRPPEIAGVEAMVGLFVNTLPVRVRLDPAVSVADLLAGLQDQQSALLPHGHLGLAEVASLAGAELAGPASCSTRA